MSNHFKLMVAALPKAKLLGVGMLLILVGAFIAAPAWPNDDCPEGSSAVTIDTGGVIITTCTDDDVIEDAEDGFSITLGTVTATCPCPFFDLVHPRNWRKYDADPTNVGYPKCRTGADGLTLRGYKAKPFSPPNDGTYNRITSGDYEAANPNLQTCQMSRVRKGNTFDSFRADLANADEEAACKLDIEAYRFAIAQYNDAYAGFSCL